MQGSAIRSAIVLALLATCHSAASFAAPRAAVVQVNVAGNGAVRYTYKGRKIGDAELDQLCRDGIKRKSPIKFHKVGGGDPMKLILVQAQCLGAGAKKVRTSGTALHPKPPHKAKAPK